MYDENTSEPEHNQGSALQNKYAGHGNAAAASLDVQKLYLDYITKIA